MHERDDFFRSAAGGMSCEVAAYKTGLSWPVAGCARCAGFCADIGADNAVFARLADVGIAPKPAEYLVSRFFW